MERRLAPPMGRVAQFVGASNFSPESVFMGSRETLRLVERFPRVAPDTIKYEITVRDPTVWIKPWTAEILLTQKADRLYEVACHEGNFAIMTDILSGAHK